jgi:hypothetical protein
MTIVMPLPESLSHGEHRGSPSAAKPARAHPANRMQRTAAERLPGNNYLTRSSASKKAVACMVVIVIVVVT